MLTLLTFPAGFGDFSLSPFCTKVAWLLEMSGETWQRQDVINPRRLPKQKLPVLQLANGRMISDSRVIRAYLDERGGHFDTGLTAEARDMALLFERMVEEHLYFLLLTDRWANDAVWPAVRQAFFGSIPGLVRRPVTGMARRSILRDLQGQGIGRMSPEERMQRADADLKVIAAQLSDRPFLLTDHPTAADASVAAIVTALRDTPVATALTRRVRNDAVLSDYVDRMRETLPLGHVCHK